MGRIIAIFSAAKLALVRLFMPFERGARPFHHLILHTLQDYENIHVFIDRLLKERPGKSVLVVIWPDYEPGMVASFFRRDVIVVVPPRRESTMPMLRKLREAEKNLTILLMHFGAEPTMYNFLVLEKLYSEMVHFCDRYDLPLIAIENINDLGQRNSAFLRRLFPRNTLI